LGDGGAKLVIPPTPLVLSVLDTQCSEVTKNIVDQGLWKQYQAGLPSGTGPMWTCTNVCYGTKPTGGINSTAIVTVPNYTDQKAGTPRKDGPTITQTQTVIEGNRTREVQGPAPNDPFVTSAGSWGQAYGDQWYLKAVRWLKDDASTVLPANASPVTVAVI